MNSLIKKESDTIFTHSKINDYNFGSPARLPIGTDPELMCSITDFAGTDVWSGFRPEAGYTFDWRRQELWYDLLHSFYGQPVFNSENHPIEDGYPAEHIPPAHTRAVLWQGFLHHQAATTMWVWQTPNNPALEGSIYHRPANVYAAGRAFFDAQRLAEQLVSINREQAEVALLYSPTSLFWDDGYRRSMFKTYTALMFSGKPVTFVSERQLENRRRSFANEKVRYMLLTRASHVKDITIDRLAEFQKGEGEVVRIGERCLTQDIYSRGRELPEALQKTPVVSPDGRDREFTERLRPVLKQAGLQRPNLKYPNGKPAWGVEYRVVQQNGTALIPLINFLPDRQTVALECDGQKAEDLIKQQEVDPKSIVLEPMSPRLIQLSRMENK